MCNTKIQTSIDLIRFINEQANKVYGGKDASFNHADYIRDCSDAFANYFQIFLKGDKYLFSTLSAWNRKKEDGVFFANDDKRYNYNITVETIFKPIIEGPDTSTNSLLNDIKNEKSISITKYVLQESYGIDVFFNGDAKYTSPIKCEKDSHKIYFFPLNKINFYSDNEQFESDSINTQEIKKLAHELKMQNDPDYTYQKACRLIWYYKKMQSEHKEGTGKDFMVHFIRPSFIDFDHNMLLSLATNDLLDKEELAIVDLILFKIVGLMATERVKQNEEIERLRNVSASTHVIKTTINGLFAPTLNSLLTETVVDDRIKELFEVKEKLLKYAEVINLVTKLSSNIHEDKAVKESLISSSLFTTDSDNRGQIMNALNEIMKVRQRDFSLTKLTYKINEVHQLSANIFVYDNKYYPASAFFELLLLTIIENVIKYGATIDGTLTFSINLFSNEISFTNKHKPNVKLEIKVDDMTGNFRVFHTILTKLSLGSLIISPDRDEFKVCLKSF
ncbi:MAG: hypothetical protein JXB49_22905 [Bacteroidales bacterium]|nr:hypothetical protein [Bacteroidales bacterium]